MHFPAHSAREPVPETEYDALSSPQASSPTAIITRAITTDDIPAVSALHALVFGPGRFARTAYRVREGSPALLSRFCRLAETCVASGTRLMAALRLSDIRIGDTEGALLLGPLAVAPGCAGQGFGRRLVEESLTEARKAGVRLVVLVGDVPYYGRFGFIPVPPGQIVFPGPVNPARILALELQDGVLPMYAGLVKALSRETERPVISA